MQPPSLAVANTFRGIEVMTMWAEVAPAGNYPALRAVLPTDDLGDVAAVIQGLMNVCGLLLQRCSQATGDSYTETLQQLALNLAARAAGTGD